MLADPLDVGFPTISNDPTGARSYPTGASPSTTLAVRQGAQTSRANTPVFFYDEETGEMYPSNHQQIKPSLPCVLPG